MRGGEGALNVCYGWKADIHGLGDCIPLDDTLRELYGSFPVRPVSGTLITLLTLAGCSRAEAGPLDATNPMHCTLVLTSFEQVAQQLGDGKTARSLGVRASWYGMQSRTLPEDQRSEAAMKFVMDKLLADPTGSEELGMECQRRQNEDPQCRP